MRHNFCLEGIYHSVVSHAHTHTYTRAHASTHTHTNWDCSTLQWQEHSHKVMSENCGSHEKDTGSSQEAHGRLANSESWMKYLRKDEYELSKKWGWREGKIIPHGIIGKLEFKSRQSDFRILAIKHPCTIWHLGLGHSQ